MFIGLIKQLELSDSLLEDIVPQDHDLVKLKKVSRGHVYWQIVESRRVGGKPRPIVLEHLGSAEKLLQRLRGTPWVPAKAKVIKFGAQEARCSARSEDQAGPQPEVRSTRERIQQRVLIS